MTHVDAYRLYGCLPLDCWYLIGKRSSVTVQCKIAATCSKLKKLYFQHYELEKWINCIKPQNWSTAFFEASKYGHRDIIDVISLKIINQSNQSNCVYINRWYYWYQGILGAAQGGHRNLVDFFIEKGANSWNAGLWSAAKGGHRDLAVFFIGKCINDGTDINWNQGLYCAAQGGYRELVEFFIENGADDFNWALEAAAAGGHRGLVDFFISKHESVGDINWNWGLHGAQNGDHLDLIDFFKQKIAEREETQKMTGERENE